MTLHLDLHSMGKYLKTQGTLPAEAICSSTRKGTAGGWAPIHYIDAAMINTTVLVSDEPFDPREVERLSAVRVGRIPRLKKFDGVWHKDGDGWHAVVIERRCPGDVYWARKKSGRFRGFAVVVCAGSYGGKV